jgi:hypothetical protein
MKWHDASLSANTGSVDGKNGLRIGTIIFVNFLVIAVSLYCSMQLVRSGGLATDFKVFWTSVRSGAPYAPNDWPFGYPPTMLLWLQPLRLIPLWPAFMLWGLASLAAFVASLRSNRLLALAAFPTAFVALTGQSSLFVAALLFTAFRSRATGILLGLAFTIKPQLVFLAPLALMMVRNWHQLGMMVLTVLLLGLASGVIFGPTIWLDWLNSIPHFQKRVAEIGVLGGAASPSGWATWMGWNPLPFLLGGFAIGLMALICSFENAEEKGALVGLCCVVASPYALIYDLVVILPIALSHLRRIEWRTIPAMFAMTVQWQVLGVVGLVLGLIRRAGPS